MKKVLIDFEKLSPGIKILLFPILAKAIGIWKTTALLYGKSILGKK